MNKVYAFKTEQRTSVAITVIVGLIIVILSIGLFFITARPIGNPSGTPGYFLTQLIYTYPVLGLVIGGCLIFFSMRPFLIKLKIADGILRIRNFLNLNQIEIEKITEIGNRYEIKKPSWRGLLPSSVRQCGLLIKEQSGKIYEIPRDIQKPQQFISDLQKINPHIVYNEGLSQQSKAQIEKEISETSDTKRGSLFK